MTTLRIADLVIRWTLALIVSVCWCVNVGWLASGACVAMGLPDSAFLGGVCIGLSLVAGLVGGGWMLALTADPIEE